jgi:hypothetical protein
MSIGLKVGQAYDTSSRFRLGKKDSDDRAFRRDSKVAFGAARALAIQRA